jgi:hypothetical protein
VFPDNPEKRKASQLFQAAIDSVINSLIIKFTTFFACYISLHHESGYGFGDQDLVPKNNNNKRRNFDSHI